MSHRPDLAALRLEKVPGRRGARQFTWRGECLLSLEVACHRARTVEQLAQDIGAPAAIVRRLARRMGLPERFDYAWVDDLRVPAPWRSRGLARLALDQLQRQTGAMLLVMLGPATAARMSPVVRRRVYQALGFSLFGVDGHQFGARPPQAPRLGLDGPRKEPVTPVTSPLSHPRAGQTPPPARPGPRAGRPPR